MDRPRILLADFSEELIDQILHHGPAKERYEFDTVSSGAEFWEKIESFSPKLIYLDLMLPNMHGLEITKKLRSEKKYKEVGIILASASPMIQNYDAAIHEGVNYFLVKPFAIDFLIALFDRFFSVGLSPDPFEKAHDKSAENGSIYAPSLQNPSSYLKFWGTRGSNPVSGTDYVRFGGNTSCLEVRKGKDLVIIDAGTGIRPLGDSLIHEELRTINLFLGHTHWDHITGFPFFNPIYHSNCELIIWSPIGFDKSTQELFTEMLAYAYFPVRLDDIQAKIVFKDLRDSQPVTIGDITIEPTYAYHPGSTLCFKIHIDGKTYGYATDNEIFLGYLGSPNTISKDDRLIRDHEKIIRFFKNCDILIHEAQYFPQEYQKRVGWGHSSMSNATLLAKYTGAKRWIVTHHDPKHTDEELLKKQQVHRNILQECHVDCTIQLAYDGFILPLM